MARFDRKQWHSQTEIANKTTITRRIKNLRVFTTIFFDVNKFFQQIYICILKQKNILVRKTVIYHFSIYLKPI